MSKELGFKGWEIYQNGGHIFSAANIVYYDRLVCVMCGYPLGAVHETPHCTVKDQDYVYATDEFREVLQSW